MAKSNAVDLAGKAVVATGAAALGNILLGPQVVQTLTQAGIKVDDVVGRALAGVVAAIGTLVVADAGINAAKGDISKMDAVSDLITGGAAGAAGLRAHRGGGGRGRGGWRGQRRRLLRGAVQHVPLHAGGADGHGRL